MPRAKKSNDGRPIESYDHAGKERLNNPPLREAPPPKPCIAPEEP